MDCFFDEESIGWGDNWVRALERAIDECKFIVFVLSPDFCESEWVQVERTSSLATDPSGLQQKIRPVLLRECRHPVSFPRFLQPLQLIDVSSEERFQSNYPRICAALGGIFEEPVLFERGSLPPVIPLPTPHRMPYHSLADGFVGRVDALWQVYDKPNKGQTTIVQGVGVVMGMGGLGKSQLATEYVHRFGRSYPGGVFWIDADQGLRRVIEQITDAAGLQIDGKQSEDQQLENVWKQLSGRLPSLVVLDNFPEDAFLRSYLPPTGRIHTW